MNIKTEHLLLFGDLMNVIYPKCEDIVSALEDYNFEHRNPHYPPVSYYFESVKIDRSCGDVIILYSTDLDKNPTEFRVPFDAFIKDLDANEHIEEWIYEY